MSLISSEKVLFELEMNYFFNSFKEQKYYNCTQNQSNIKKVYNVKSMMELSNLCA